VCIIPVVFLEDVGELFYGLRYFDFASIPVATPTVANLGVCNQILGVGDEVQSEAVHLAAKYSEGQNRG
jgi:hypothetical protein